jgi:hypothetical protein
MRYRAPNAADETLLNHHFHTDAIVELTPIKKQSETSQPIEKLPTGNGCSERQTEEPLDDEIPLKRNKKSR